MECLQAVFANKTLQIVTVYTTHFTTTFMLSEPKIKQFLVVSSLALDAIKTYDDTTTTSIILVLSLLLLILCAIKLPVGKRA